MLFPNSSLHLYWFKCLKENGSSLFPHLSTPHSQRRPNQMTFWHITPANCPSSFFNSIFPTGIWTENKRVDETGRGGRKCKHTAHNERKVFSIVPWKKDKIFGFFPSQHPQSPTYKTTLKDKPGPGTYKLSSVFHPIFSFTTFHTQVAPAEFSHNSHSQYPKGIAPLSQSFIV